MLIINRQLTAEEEAAIIKLTAEKNKERAVRGESPITETDFINFGLSQRLAEAVLTASELEAEEIRQKFLMADAAKREQVKTVLES